MLAPLISCPSALNSAAPTRNLLYGMYAPSRAVLATHKYTRQPCRPSRTRKCRCYELFALVGCETHDSQSHVRIGGIRVVSFLPTVTADQVPDAARGDFSAF